MLKFLLLADLHVYNTFVGNRILTDRLATIRQDYPEHRVIIAGDMTDNGSIMEYAQAFDLLEPFQGRIFVCPGNHDYGWVGNFYEPSCVKRFASFRTALGGPTMRRKVPVVQRVCDGNIQILVVGCDSNLRTTTLLDFARGEIGWWQSWRLWLALFRSRAEVKIVYLHHHPFDHTDYFVRLKDDRRFLKRIQGKCDLLCFGHRHQMRYYAEIAGIPYVLAAGSLRESSKVFEILVEGCDIAINVIEL